MSSSQNQNELIEKEDVLLRKAIGNIQHWNKLDADLLGTKVLEKPRISKKVLVAGMQLQSAAIQGMSEEFRRLNQEIRNTNAAIVRTNLHVKQVEDHSNAVEIQLLKSLEHVTALENRIIEQDAKIERLEKMESRIESNEKKLAQQEATLEEHRGIHKSIEILIDKTVEANEAIRGELNEFMVYVQERFDQEKEEIEITSDQVLIALDSFKNERGEFTTLTDRIEEELKMEHDRKKDTAEQKKFVREEMKRTQELLYDTRKVLEENTDHLEQVERQLLDKADRVKMNEMIESKYQEIIDHLQKALSSITDDEDEFKRISKELQELVQHLNASKADKKDVLEIKEQVVYDAKIRQQVEHLRSFVDLKVNRDEVLGELEAKVDKTDMQELLEQMTSSLNATIQAALSSHTTSSTLDPRLGFQTPSTRPQNGHDTKSTKNIKPLARQSSNSKIPAPIQRSGATITKRNIKVPNPLPSLEADNSGIQTPNSESNGAILHSLPPEVKKIGVAGSDRYMILVQY